VKTKPQSHTPGPWKVSKEYNGTFVRAAHGGLVASMESGSQTMRDMDVVLIAAAPELFDMLIEALPYIECAAETDTTYKPGAVRNLVNRIRKVVDKAEVQS